jgi:maltoporin
VTYKRPNAGGAGVTDWNVGTAQVSILTPPTAGLSSASIVDDEIEASDTLVLTNSATNANAYEYRVNGILRSTSATPNLTKWLRMGENVIQQKVINSAGEDTETLTFDVVEKLITVTTPPHTLTGLSSGLTLTIDVKAVDANDNESAYSSSIEFVTE